ncbi:MAG: GNAT family N-acetyltransferase [Ferruginibacter sp.]
MEIFVETERLILREILLTDIEGMFELDSDPEVHQYLGNQPVTDKEKMKEVILFVQQQYKENGIGRWAVIEKSSNKFLGWSGLKLVKEMTNNQINYYDLGYRLIRKYWGKGYATESAKAAMDYGFEHLQFNELFAMAHINNTASNKVLQKLGLQHQNSFLYDNAMHHWYAIHKNEWANGQKKP